MYAQRMKDPLKLNGVSVAIVKYLDRTDEIV